jgi:hypothetical protein
MRRRIALVALYALAAFLADSRPATADRGVSLFATSGRQPAWAPGR